MSELLSFQNRIEALIGISEPEVGTTAYDTAISNGCQELINLVPKDMLWGLGKDYTISKGSVKSITVDVEGDGYVNPQPLWSQPDMENGVEPTVEFVLASDGGSNKKITDVIIYHPGSGYKDLEPILTTDEDEGNLGNIDAVFSVEVFGESASISTNTILHVLRETESFTNASGDTLDTSDPDNIIVLDDRTSVVECREIPAALKGRVRPGSGWAEEVTENDPVYYKENGKVYILPLPYMSDSKVVTAEVPEEIDHESEKGTLPAELEYLIDLYAAIYVLNIHIRNIAFPQLDESTYDQMDFKAVLSGPDFSDIDANFPINFNEYPDLDDNDLILASGSYIDYDGGDGGSDEITFTDPDSAFDLSGDFTTLQSFIDEEDPDLVAMQTQKMQMKLAEYQANQSNALQDMNAQVQGAQQRLQESIQERGAKNTATEKEKSLQLALVKGKLERRVSAVTEIIQQYGSSIQKVQTFLQEFQAKLNSYDLQKKQKQELQVSLMNNYNGGVQALISRYKGESREIANPVLQQPQVQGAG